MAYPTRSGIRLASAALCLAAATSQAQMAKGASKFLGNITTGNSVLPDFETYWNQISPENEGKWGSVEKDNGTFTWGGMNALKTWAARTGNPYKFHALVWGAQQPGWINNLSQADQQKEIKQWFDAAAANFPNVHMIDVVNEAYPTHAPAPYRAALSAQAKASGFTGEYDWIMEAFKMARARWPKAILIYNDYNNLEYKNEIDWTINLVKAFKAQGAPIDAIGCQAHDMDMETQRSLIKAAEITSTIDKLAATGLPVFITEYDISYTDDQKQLTVYKDQFPAMWMHPKVAGITIWGYIVGRTWSLAPNSGLTTSGHVDRPAMTWLKDYVKKNPNPPTDFPEMAKAMGMTVSVEARPATVSAANSGLVVRNVDGRLVTGIEKNGQFLAVTALGSR